MSNWILRLVLATSLLPAARPFTTIQSFNSHAPLRKLRGHGPSGADMQIKRRAVSSGMSVKAVVFEPVAPNLAQTSVVLMSTVGLASYWWLIFVPSERRDLAKNKNKGGLNTYLEDLETSNGRELEKWFYTEWLQRRRKVRSLSEKSSQSMEDRIDQEIDKAIPTPNFFSLDNPVLVAVLIMMSGVAFAGLSGR